MANLTSISLKMSKKFKHSLNRVKKGFLILKLIKFFSKFAPNYISHLQKLLTNLIVWNECYKPNMASFTKNLIVIDEHEIVVKD